MRGRILVVDDERLTRETLVERLRDGGYDTMRWTTSLWMPWESVGLDHRSLGGLPANLREGGQSTGALNATLDQVVLLRLDAERFFDVRP